MNNYKELLDYLLPEKILDYFDYHSINKKDGILEITLREKKKLPQLPVEHRDKKIITKGYKDICIDDFPIRGKKVILRLRRRIWKIEGVEELFKQPIDIAHTGTKLEKEFADFLKM